MRIKAYVATPSSVDKRDFFFNIFEVEVLAVYYVTRQVIYVNGIHNKFLHCEFGETTDLDVTCPHNSNLLLLDELECE